MFRSRRTTLVKRLWKCRVPGQNETACPTESSQELEIKSVAHSMLKRLKEKHLEVLVQSVESRGGETTECVLLPKEDLRLARRTVAPHVLCCQIWRWPELIMIWSGDHLLKRLPCCFSQDDPTSVCCNPYHWSVVKVPDSPPPPYSGALTQRVFIKQEGPRIEEEICSTETGGTPTALRLADGSTSTGRPYWCNIAYWELRRRVGRLFTVSDSSIHVFQELPHGDGMCLSVLQQQHPAQTESIHRTRKKIGFGVTLCREQDGVWVYNRSDYPIFVNSPTLDLANARTSSVHKVLPGYSLEIFDYEKAEILEHVRDQQYLDGPYDPKSIRISFAKGWGPHYSRQFITCCPCWLEVLLSVNR